MTSVRIEIVLFPGFDELDAIGPYEVLRHARSFGAAFHVALVSVEPAEWVEAAHGLSVKPHGLLELKNPPALVVVPGGGWNSRSAQGAWGEAQRGILPRALVEMHRRGTVITSVCTGAMILASAGLLKGRSATTHHDAIEELRQMQVSIGAGRVVEDATFLTAGGVTSGIDLGLCIVERYASRELADRVARHIEYSRR